MRNQKQNNWDVWDSTNLNTDTHNTDNDNLIDVIVFTFGCTLED